ncbi:hypothetical protein Bca101_059196 [Brassica carinata]
MSRRYSREEKKKWIPTPNQAKRKPPVQIPAANTAALIEENKFTLIGRVTNPSVQNTKALVEFFLQHWNVTGRITGRDLGPLLFQFRFENERDLLTILNKAPFHFKRWMLLIQRWEPIVSDKFPADIPFWIQIHGLPLHYWSDEAIRAIGGELGFVEACIPTQARVRVVINGLNPLEMIRDISLPSGETTEVEFDYEKLEKHCFKCFSLSHEKAECPVSTGPCEENGNPERLGISQNNTMARLDDKRRRYEERRKDKAPLTQKPRDSSTLYTRRNESDDRRSEQRYNSRHQLNYSPVTSEYRRGREEHRRERSFYRAPDDRTGSRSSLHISGRVAGYLDTRRKEDDKSADRAAKERGHSHDSGSKTIQSPALPEVVPHSSDLRRTLPRREQEEDFAPQVSSDRRPTRNRLSSIAAPHSSDLRLSLVQKSADRLPVKERLSLPSNGKQKLVQQGNSTGSSKLQDIEIQYLEEIMEPPRQESISRPSGSRLHGIPRSPTDEESPIRTLSEDRRHVSLRLGPLSASSPSDLPVHSRLSEGPEIITRSVAKKRAGTNKADARSALQMQQPAFDDDDEVEECPSRPNLKKGKGPMDRFVSPTPPDVLKGRKDRKDIFGVCDKELRDNACSAIAKWFYDAAIPFNAANYDSFREAIELVAQYGFGFKTPSMYELRVPLLIKEVKEVEEQLVEHKAEWVAKGCSIMSDGCRVSVVQKNIFNFLVNSPKGSVFIKSVDVSEAVKDANLLFSMLDRMVDEVGEANVVQVVTDNASNYVKTGKLLMAKIPHLYWLPCAAHCIDLMLEDIGKIPTIKTAIRNCIFMNGYIYGHTSMVNTMRRFTNQGNLHRPAVTRFSTSFITLGQYYHHRDRESL